MLDKPRPNKAGPALTDPVCGMQVAADSGYRHAQEGTEYSFCSAACRDKFVANWDWRPTLPASCVPTAGRKTAGTGQAGGYVAGASGRERAGGRRGNRRQQCGGRVDGDR